MSLSTADKGYFNLHIKGYKVDSQNCMNRIYLFVNHSASNWNSAKMLRNVQEIEIKWPSIGLNLLLSEGPCLTTAKWFKNYLPSQWRVF